MESSEIGTTAAIVATPVASNSTWARPDFGHHLKVVNSLQEAFEVFPSKQPVAVHRVPSHRDFACFAPGPDGSLRDAENGRILCDPRNLTLEQPNVEELVERWEKRPVLFNVIERLERRSRITSDTSRRDPHTGRALPLRREKKLLAVGGAIHTHRQCG